MRSSCKGVNSVILRIVSTFANQKKPTTKHGEAGQKKKRERKKKKNKK